jgi:hypothetical protein
MPEYADDVAPREIVTDLHAEIAAQSPEHAALVAAYEALPARPGYPLRRARRPAGGMSAARLRRLEVYTALRLSGTGAKAAATRAGISHHTGRQYEADLIASLGGGT